MKTIIMIFLLCAAVGAAQAEVVSIGDIQLQLGSSESEVLRILQPQYAVVRISGENRYNIHNRGTAGRADGPSVARIEFEQQRLQRVVKSVATLQGQEADKSMRRLILELTNARATGGDIEIETNIEESVAAVTSWVIFRLPDKILQLAVYEPKQDGAPVTVDITEQYILAK